MDNKNAVSAHAKAVGALKKLSQGNYNHQTHISIIYNLCTTTHVHATHTNTYIYILIGARGVRNRLLEFQALFATEIILSATPKRLLWFDVVLTDSNATGSFLALVIATNPLSPL